MIYIEIGQTNMLDNRYRFSLLFYCNFKECINLISGCILVMLQTQ
jgi:hypothetical protein